MVIDREPGLSVVVRGPFDGRLAQSRARDGHDRTIVAHAVQGRLRDGDGGAGLVGDRLEPTDGVVEVVRAGRLPLANGEGGGLLRWSWNRTAFLGGWSRAVWVGCDGVATVFDDAVQVDGQRVGGEALGREALNLRSRRTRTGGTQPKMSSVPPVGHRGSLMRRR